GAVGPGSGPGLREAWRYDGHRRVREAELTYGDQGLSRPQVYGYDLEGRRITSSDAPSSYEPLVYAYEGSQVIGVGYRRASGIAWRYAIGRGPVGPVFIKDLVEGDDYFLFCDHLGTPFGYWRVRTGE